MEDLSLNHLLVILGIVAIVLEMFIGVATGFDLVVVGSIFILAGLSGMVTGIYLVPFVVIVLLTLVYFLSFRKLLKKKLTVMTQPTNADALMGKKGKVTKAIAKDTAGRVTIDGETWRATAHTALAENEQVVVESVSGVTVQVSKVNSK